MNRIIIALGLASLILATLGFAAAASEQNEPEGHRGFMAAKGRITYRVYCSNCHGPDARGNGPVAQFLTVEPSDLTLLAAGNEGLFPASDLTQVIDGRKEVRGHGRKEMPIWGDVFQDSLSEPEPTGGETGEARARRKISELVLYIETLQQDAAADGPAEGDER